MSDALSKLIEAVETGERGAGLNTAAVFGDNQIAMDTVDAFDGSLDAAKALHEALLPGWSTVMSKNLHSGLWYAWVQDKESAQFCANEPTPARAWLLAVLRAYAAQQEPTP